MAPGVAARNRVLKQYRISAHARGLVWDLPAAYFFYLTRLTCHYCGCAPKTVSSTPRGEYVYNGVDRKNNLSGYLVGNVVACCSVCNHAKKDMQHEEFMAWLKRIADHHK